MREQVLPNTYRLPCCAERIQDTAVVCKQCENDLFCRKPYLVNRQLHKQIVLADVRLPSGRIRHEHLRHEPNPEMRLQVAPRV
jgi:hypothetical protein